MSDDHDRDDDDPVDDEISEAAREAAAQGVSPELKRNMDALLKAMRPLDGLAIRPVDIAIPKMPIVKMSDVTGAKISPKIYDRPLPEMTSPLADVDIHLARNPVLDTNDLLASHTEVLTQQAQILTDQAHNLQQLLVEQQQESQERAKEARAARRREIVVIVVAVLTFLATLLGIVVTSQSG